MANPETSLQTQETSQASPKSAALPSMRIGEKSKTLIFKLEDLSQHSCLD